MTESRELFLQKNSILDNLNRRSKKTTLHILEKSTTINNQKRALCKCELKNRSAFIATIEIMETFS